MNSRIMMSVVFLCAGLASCGGKEAQAPVPASQETRNFYMGFQPWFYEATAEAVNWVYGKIAEDGDMISHHIEEGVPWNEAFNEQAYSSEFQAANQDRLDRRVSGQKVLLQINPMNTGRTGLADYRNASINSSLPAPWNTYAFNSTEVKTAYLNYAKQMIANFSPDFLIIGIEANLLIRNSPSQWAQYVELHRDTYTALKALHPSLPIGVSLFAPAFFQATSPSDDAAAQLAGLRDLEAYTDFISFSVYPYISTLLADTMPEDYFDNLFSLTSKPVAISESAYPAQVWSTTTPPTNTWNGDEDKQKNFVRLMLAEAKDHQALFVIWFTIRDYDALWLNTLGSAESSLPWRDTGLYGEDGSERSALSLWKSWKRFTYSR